MESPFQRKDLFAFIGLLVALCTYPASGQDAYDPSWYDPSQPYLKLGVTEDGVYGISGSELEAQGISLSQTDARSFRLLENGVEVPIYYTGDDASMMAPSDRLVFVGRRNTGEDEDYLYNWDAGARSSRYHSLFTDTTYYWLTWGAAAGSRYESGPAGSGISPVVTTDSHLRREPDQAYYVGDGINRGNPLYTDREGYYWLLVSHNVDASPLTRTFDARLSNPTASPSDTAIVQVRINPQTSSRHRVTLRLRQFNGSSNVIVDADTVDWFGLSLVTLEARVPQDRLPTDGNLQVQLYSENSFGGATPNNWYLDWIDIEYRRNLIAVDGQTSFLLDSSGDFEIQVGGFSSSEAILLEPTNGNAWPDSVVAGQLTTRLIAGPGTYYVSGIDAIRTPSTLRDDPSDLANTANAADYIILRPSALAASASALAEYRGSPAGGGLIAQAVDLQDVFDQFDYGRPTPIAVRRFIRSMLDWSTEPQFLVLWGDALYPDKSRSRSPWEMLSFGRTASDGWFAMQNGGISDWSESIAIGRVPVRSNTFGLNFVDKIADYESKPIDRWQKSALFLAGGRSETERRLLQSNALRWSDIVSGDPTSLDTLHFFKLSTEALDPTFKASIQEALESGASWTTYFGHSATTTWEIVTDPPAQFGNAGRLPVVVSLGCLTGNFAAGNGADSDVVSFGEQLLIESMNGSIAHWGASGGGTIGASAALSDELHQSIFTDSLRVLGIGIQKAKARFNGRFTDPLSVRHLLQFSLLGDPATRLSLPIEPEFVVGPEQISISPIAPIPADSQLTVTVNLENLGLTPADSVLVRVTRARPDRSTEIVHRLVPRFGRYRVEQFTFPLDEESIGENTFRVDVDADLRYDETDELNNSAERSTVVFATGLSIVDPPPMGLVPTTNPALQVAPSRSQAGDIPVLFQLDDRPSFDSPALRQQQITASDLTASWQPSGLVADSTYYWRARIEGAEPSSWQDGSFTIRPDIGEVGWLQRSSLFDENESDGVLERSSGKWVLRQFKLDIVANADLGQGQFFGQFIVSGQAGVELATIGFGLLGIDGITGNVAGSVSAAPYPNPREDHTTAIATLRAFIDALDDGDFLFVRSRHMENTNGLVDIPDSVKAIFRSLGSTAIDTLTYQDLWIMSARKGFPQSTEEWVEPAGGAVELSRSKSLFFSVGKGKTVSPGIGPAQTWGSFGWTRDLVHPDNDIVVNIVDPNSRDTIVSGVNTEGVVDLGFVDALAHPRLSLEARFLDSTNAATPQLLDWWITYTPVAELAIDPVATVVRPDTAQEGQNLDVEVGVANLSSAAASVVLLDYYLTTPANQRRLLATDSLGSLAGTASASSSLSIDTRSLAGTSTLEFRLRQPDRPEPITYNNVFVKPVTITRDVSPPSLEITIDGEVVPPDPDPVVNLQDPALPFVSLRPVIGISVRDENDFLSLSGDSTIVRVLLDGNEIPFSDLTRPSAKKAGDELTVLFEPELPALDTVHTVIVEVFDATGNPSPDNPYQVHFRTQTDVQVEGIYPYPNPMSSSTTFAFRLRGADTFTVDDFRLRIYTITGRLIREFDLIRDPWLLEAGALRIGWNKLNWDGRDEDGDLVGTGVYLYKVFARESGNELDFGGMAAVEKIVVIR